MKSTNNNLASDQSYLDLLQEVDYNPIFILGDHRSGTTILYKMLVATGCFNFVKAYHIIKYDEILFNHLNHNESQAIQELEEKFKSLKINNRAFDSIGVTPNLPEEYGFILNNVAKDESHITPNNVQIFYQLCRKIQFTSNLHQPLLLKNPWDYPKFMYVKSIVPNAKFIFIHRHPLHVMNSKLKAVRIALSSWNAYTALISHRYRKIFNNPLQRYFYLLLYSPYFNLGLHRVTQQSLESTTYFLEHINLLSNSDYVCVRYEDLCKDPQASIQKITELLGLKVRANLEYQELIKPRPLELLPEVQRQYKQICQKLSAYLAYHGYDA